jgi:membrane-bound lytic murein transglycosylase MltF
MEHARPQALDGADAAYLGELARRWEATGLDVTLDLAAAEAGRWVLHARSPAMELAIAGRRWRRGGWLGRQRHTAEVRTRRREEGARSRTIGVAAGRTLDRTCRRVLAWMDGRAPLHDGLAAALVAPRARVSRGADPRLPPSGMGRLPALAAGLVLLAVVASGLVAGFGLGLGLFRPGTEPDIVAAPVPETIAEPSPPPAMAATAPAEAPLPAPLAPVANARHTGDLDVLLRTGSIRVLTAYSRTDFFVDRGETGGFAHAYMLAFEGHLRRLTRGKAPVMPVVHFVPVSRDRLIPALLAGEGDIAAASLTVTPERARLVDFSAPYLDAVKEVVVTGPASRKLARVEDLAGRTLLLRPSSSYWASALALNERFRREGRPELRLQTADEHLEDEDLLEMLNAGLIELAVVDDHKARLWARVLRRIEVHEDMALRERGQIAFAVRKDSPALKAALDGFVREHRKGTLFGNLAYAKFLAATDRLLDNGGKTERKRFLDLLGLFRIYGERYAFDPLLLAAQGFQESRLDQKARSPRGAIGIMQVLPATARDPNVDIPDVRLPADNIHAAAKYMRFVLDTYFPGARFDDFNRAMFAFAAYNAGPAKVAKLRRIAASRGLDPDRWFGHVELVAAERIGRETVQYVSNILKYYTVYSRVAAIEAGKEKARTSVKASL